MFGTIAWASHEQHGGQTEGKQMPVDNLKLEPIIKEP